MLGRFISSFLLMFGSFVLLNANTDAGFAIDNFVLTDINGEKYELDQMMREGKHVVLNFGTTWAPSSWRYEKTEVLSNVKKLNDLSGKENLVVLFLEADLKTDLNCIRGNESCNYSSMGDWTKVIDYPIVDLTEEELNFLKKYQIDEYPTIYGIKPDRSISSLGQADMSRVLSWMEGTPFAYQMPTTINVSSNLAASYISRLSDFALQSLLRANNPNTENTNHMTVNYLKTEVKFTGVYHNKYAKDGILSVNESEGLNIIASALWDTESLFSQSAVSSR